MANSNEVGGFGLGQLMKDTPQFIKNLRKALNFFSGGVVTFLPFIAKTLHTDIETCTTVMGLFMLGFNSVAAMFGVPDESKTQ
jgi:hypothetical protein